VGLVPDPTSTNVLRTDQQLVDGVTESAIRCPPVIDCSPAERSVCCRQLRFTVCYNMLPGIYIYIYIYICKTRNSARLTDQRSNYGHLVEARLLSMSVIYCLLPISNIYCDFKQQKCCTYSLYLYHLLIFN